MAEITRAEVERIASLSKLSLSEAEADTLAAELGSLLEHFEALQEVDTTGISPTAHPIPLPTPMREDQAVEPMDPALVVAGAPESAGTAFVVPKVVDSEAEG
jgi:aspartyl-tRNA(Asn)/glutamyl-tRNA(Gln) amidotransferase subunit C